MTISALPVSIMESSMIENFSLVRDATFHSAAMIADCGSSAQYYVLNLGVLQLLGFVAFVISLGLYLHSRCLCSISDIPGPFLAPFGTCWQLWQIVKGRIEEATLELHQKHGPFVRLGHDEVSINHPDALQLVLGAPLRKGNMYNVFSIPNSNYVNLMSEVDHKRCVSMKANVASGYSMSSVLRNETVIDEKITQMEERLDQLATVGKPVELGLWISFLTWDILGEVTFSKSFGFLEQGRDIRNTVANTFALALYLTCAAYAQWIHTLFLGNPILRWLDFQPSQHTSDTCSESVEARKRDPHARVDMIEHWMNTRRKYPERMSEKDIFCAAIGNVSAGGDTVSSTLQAFWYCLLKNPIYLERLQREIDTSHQRGKLSPVVTWEEAKDLPFLQACIKETLRFRTAVPWNFPRVVPKEGLTVAGHHFTSGTNLSVNPWIIHRNPALFGADAHIYNPERWLDPVQSPIFEKYLIPFGLGYNQCPGRNLALLELSKITATLVRDFDIRQVDPCQNWKYHTLFLVVPYGWPVLIRRRSAPHEGTRPTEVKGLAGEFPSDLPSKARRRMPDDST